MTEIKFWWWRVRVSFWGMRWWGFKWGEPNWWGFADDEMDRVGFDDGMTPEDYFIEAWGRD